MIDKAKLLSANSAFKLGELELPELGGKVFLRVLSSRERDALEAEFTDAKNSLSKLDNIRAKLVVRAVADDQGKRLFSDEEIGAVGDLPAPLVSKIFDAAARHNGMTSDAVEAARKN